MKLNLIYWNTQLLLEPLDQSGQMTDLAIGKTSSLTISNQADSNGSFVVVLTGFTHDMGARKLLIPSITDMDLSIGQAVAVSDEEVVAETLIAPAKVPSMHRLGGSEWLAEMMDDDSLPTIAIQGVLKHEDGVFSRPVLEISEIGQRKSGGCRGSTQIKKHYDRCHGSEEAPQNDLSSSRDRCL